MAKFICHRPACCGNCRWGGCRGNCVSLHSRKHQGDGRHFRLLGDALRLQHIPVQRLLTLRLQPLQRGGQAPLPRRALCHRPAERPRPGSPSGGNGQELKPVFEAPSRLRQPPGRAVERPYQVGIDSARRKRRAGGFWVC